MLTWCHGHIFWRCSVSHATLSYWSKFLVNIITISGIITIFCYKGLTRNPVILSSAQYLETGGVRDTKYGTSVSNEMLLNAAKWQGYSFYRFWVINGKPTGGGGEFFTPPHTQIRVKHGPILSNNNSYNILRLFTKCWFRQKRNKMVIINKKHGIYKLSQELPNDLILRIEKN